MRLPKVWITATTPGISSRSVAVWKNFFYKSILFIDAITNKVLNGWTILKSSEVILSILEENESISGEKLIKKILEKKKDIKKFPMIMNNNRTKIKKLLNESDKKFEVYWEKKWNFGHKISIIPGKELLKKILKNLEEEDFFITKRELIQTFASNPDLIPQEIVAHIKDFNSQL